ncbi:MAG: pyridoxal phosphate-dependent aminotransferase [Deltaproteobacteria bacterium]
MPSKLSEEIAPFYVMDILERAHEMEARGESVIHFEVGEPRDQTPVEICDEAARAIGRGDTRYTHSLGIPELRDAISEDLRETYGVRIPPDNIVITMGSSPALLLAFLSLLDAGDEIITTDPHYACYPQIIKIAGGAPSAVRIYEQEGFQIDVRRLKQAISPRTRAILINSPANPTGAVLLPEVMSDICSIGLPVVSDEIYHGLVYDGAQAHSIYEFTESAFLINGFSKFYSMTGWRLGYLAAPREFIRPIQKLQQNLFISPNSFVQRAGVAAIRRAKPKAQEMVELFAQRRAKMLGGLRALGFEIKSEPKGAFYVFVNAKALGGDSLALAFDILRKARVGVTPGIDFGRGGEGYLRFSYTTSVENIEEGMRRLKIYMDGKREV